MIEVLLAASPEWWQSASDDQENAWVDRSRRWLESEYGAANVAHLQLHRDETSPHLTGFVVPRDPDQDGILNAKRWVGTRGRLRAQQTSYADAVESLGLERGQEGSTARHERVRRVYGAVDAAADVRVETPPEDAGEAWAAAMDLRFDPLRAQAARAAAAETRAKAAQAEARRERERADRNERFKAQAARMTALPLPDVLDRLGFVRSDTDPDTWRAEGFTISVGDDPEGATWHDERAKVGRGGAIDLVMHVLGRESDAAISWLAHAFGNDAASREYVASAAEEAAEIVGRCAADVSPFKLPEPVPENWPAVQGHLTKERQIPEWLVSRLREGNRVYADRSRNAVFPMTAPEGAIVGAELAGTVVRPDGSRFTGLALGSSRERGAFRLGDPGASTTYLVETAIDAVCLSFLKPESGERDFSVVSTAGATGHVPEWLTSVARSLVCAFGNGEAGDRAARSLRPAGVSRLRPERGSWNEDLVALLVRARQARAAAERPRGAPEPAPVRDPPQDRQAKALWVGGQSIDPSIVENNPALVDKGLLLKLADLLEDRTVRPEDIPAILKDWDAKRDAADVSPDEGGSGPGV